MSRTIVACCLLLLLLGCQPATAPRATTPVPTPWRVLNTRAGVCQQCALATCMAAQGHKDLAVWWYKKYPAYVPRVVTHKRLKAAGIPFAVTWGKRNVAFLRWAVDNRLACVVAVRNAKHAVCLTYIDANYVCLVENKSEKQPEQDKWIRTSDFLNDWFSSGSYALTPLLKETYSPPPVR